MKTLHLRIIVSFALGVLAICSPAVLESEDAGHQLASKEWATVSGDLGNTRYSTLNRINAQTIATLAGAWTSPKFDAVGAGRAMPVVKDGILFEMAARTRRMIFPDRVFGMSGTMRTLFGLAIFPISVSIWFTTAFSILSLA